MTGTVTSLTRRQTGVARRLSYWTRRQREAPTAKAKASVSWSWLLARVAKYPESEREAIWRQVPAALDGLAPDTGRPRIKEVS
jgi:hypothetical protein